MEKNFSLFASLLLLLMLAAPAVAGDGDVNYSAPYITVDPETGELVTVNPGPELKTHSGPAGGAPAGNPGDPSGPGTGTDSNAATDASGGQSTARLPLLAVAVIGGLGALSALAFLVRGRARMTDA